MGSFYSLFICKFIFLSIKIELKVPSLNSHIPPNIQFSYFYLLCFMGEWKNLLHKGWAKFPDNILLEYYLFELCKFYYLKYFMVMVLEFFVRGIIMDREK